ncbi:MAG: hypothetical protein K6C99_04305 [Lachnospiraceae bacterium]|nr:hypothetical protein [Lachnospiraceae bacterium]
MKESAIKKRLPYLLIGIGLFITMCNVYHIDLNTNMRQGMNFWRALFEDNVLQYYSVNVDSYNAGEMTDKANYGMFINIINAVWVLPLYIAERLRGGNILDAFAARLWGKLFIVLLLGLTVIYVDKLAALLKYDDKRRNYLKVLYVCSPLVIMPVCQVAQFDILGLLFCLIAVYRILQEDKKGFFLFFVLAVLSKDLPFLVLLPVLLLFEKNLFKLVGIVVSPFLIDKLLELPFKLADPAGIYSKKSRLWMMVDFLTRSRVNLLGGVEIPVIFLAMCALCMWAYYQNAKDLSEERKQKIAIMLAAVGMLPMLLLTKANAYWCLYSVPFCLLLVMSREKKLFIRIVLERFAAFSLTAAFMIHATGYYSKVAGMLPEFLLGDKIDRANSISEKISDFFLQEKYYNFWTLSYAAYIVWVVGFIYYELRELSVIESNNNGSPLPWVDGTSKNLRILIILASAGAFILCNMYVILGFLAALWGR